MGYGLVQRLAAQRRMHAASGDGSPRLGEMVAAHPHGAYQTPPLLSPANTTPHPAFTVLEQQQRQPSMIAMPRSQLTSIPFNLPAELPTFSESLNGVHGVFERNAALEQLVHLRCIMQRGAY
jgi:hypothetical protein